MRTSTQLKALIRNISAEKNIKSEILIRNFMFERLLERISLSEYKEKFIIKGGMLIASIVGIEARSTMDLDATIRGFILEPTEIEKVFSEILKMNIEDGMQMNLTKIEKIRDESEYPGIRVYINSTLDRTKLTLKVDITTGDRITPFALQHEYKMMFENRNISILAYNLETVLSEKLETILSRGTANTRMRDYYDVYILMKLHEQDLNYEILNSAFKETATHRGSYDNILVRKKDYIKIIEESQELERLWSQYSKKNNYVSELEWLEALNSVKRVLEKMENLRL